MVRGTSWAAVLFLLGLCACNGVVLTGSAPWLTPVASSLDLAGGPWDSVSGFVFGIIVALAGCMRGMQCGRSASAVGEAATSAVVTAIVGIIVSTAVITVLCNFLGI